MANVTLNDVQRLTELIAAHGVYALTVLVIVYLQFMAKRNLDQAKPEDHEYFRKWHASTWIATWVMILLSTSVWFYATFKFKASQPYVHGSVLGLVEQPVAPVKPDDPAELIEQIVPASHTADLYANRKFSDDSFAKGTYDLDWMLVPREGAVAAVVFTFQHHYSIFRPQPALYPGAAAGPTSIESSLIRRTFTIDLNALHVAPSTSVQLNYESDATDPIRKIGRLYMWNGSLRVPIDWQTDVPPAVKPSARLEDAPFLSRLVPRLLAASLSTPVLFDAAGHYSPQVGRVLRERLGNADLQVQLPAYAQLVASGKRCFTFVADCLASNDGGYDRELLVTNLARAVAEIERSGERAPTDLDVQLALALATTQDFPLAASFFDRAAAEPLSNPNWYYTRGFTYSQVGHYDKAMADFGRYLQSAPSPLAKAMATTNIGWCYKQLNQVDAAIERYRLAITIDPTYARAYNNLAFLYAERGDHLTEAIALATRALALNHEPAQEANFKDTKGWALYSSGQYQASVALLKEAAAAAPYDLGVKAHLQEAQAVMLKRAR